MSYVVAVRALCEFTAKQGDLDVRFTPAPSAQEGIAGHTLIATRRKKNRGKYYESEVSLNGEYKRLRIRGRADGYDAGFNRVEEVKTFRGNLSAMPENHRYLHWAQVKIYAWFLCQTRELKEINVALVYVDIDTQEETLLVEKYAAASLKLFFEQHCERFITWAEQESDHRIKRDIALSQLPFPYACFRPGQRYLAESVYKASIVGCHLMAQAPTGIGKTIATIFPLLKAMPRQKIDKIFFLAAKTSGRSLALDASQLIREGKEGGETKLPLRVLEMVARDKSCEHPDKACHGDSCPLAKGFYDRLTEARQAAVEALFLDQQLLRSIALNHQLCPYYLSQELVRWSDVVVGDYNYYFDSSAILWNLTREHAWRVAVLIDEAHNLVERARKMYSAELDQTNFRLARKAAPIWLKTALARVNRLWNALLKNQKSEYQVHPFIGDKFLLSLQQAVTEITKVVAEDVAGINEDLQRFYFDAMHFSTLAESFGDHSLFDITKEIQSERSAHSVLCIRNIVPAPFLKQRFETAHCAALFSATLSPQNFYADMLGLSDDIAWIDVESPFVAAQLAVHTVHAISTRYQHRAQSLVPISNLMARQYTNHPGNYLAFFSSFEYLNQVSRLFVERYPSIPIWQQTRRMDERERARFLEHFNTEGKGIGFAVLGGAFGEGIDLPGDRLIGVFVTTLGLPPLNPVNEAMRQQMGAMFGQEQGYNYTYLYPGLQKVVQAAGRVIRTQQDHGVIYLIDDRFGRSEVMQLLPAWWPRKLAAVENGNSKVP
ncbi:MAG: DinG family ATP-dependent helicase [Solimicrobium sp.]|nr:DinG family ATP-dependent helicase [Solimicrobium sp.]